MEGDDVEADGAVAQGVVEGAAAETLSERRDRLWIEDLGPVEPCGAGVGGAA